MSKRRTDWQNVALPAARKIVESYDTGVTLRQLFYRLVARQSIPNTTGAYNTLSHMTAELRRNGEFPPLIDKTRGIVEAQTFSSPEEAREWLADRYRRDRTEGQPWSIYLGVEKEGITEQLRAWFGHLGVPILALRGYSSEGFEREIGEHLEKQPERPSILVYAGDFDASGEDIFRNFTEQVTFDEVRLVALTPEQITEHSLPIAPGKVGDRRAAKFVERHGDLMQVELDALPPEVLRQLFTDAIEEFWDDAAYNDVLRREAQEREDWFMRNGV